MIINVVEEIKNILFFLILYKLKDWLFFWFFDKINDSLFFIICLEYSKEKYMCSFFKLVDFYMDNCFKLVGC